MLKLLLTSLSGLACAAMLAACSQKAVDVDRAVSDADALRVKGRIEEARSLLQTALRSAPTDDRLLFLSGRTEESAGDMNAAISQYVAAARFGADKRPAQFKIISLLSENGNLPAALNILHQILASRPADTDALAWRALVEDEMGRPEKARETANAVLARAPHNSVANAVIATQALQQQDLETATTAIAQGIDKKHPEPILLRIQANAYASANQLEKAIALERLLLVDRPHSVGLRAILAEHLAKARSVDEGEASLKEASDRYPTDYNIGIALIDFLQKHRGQPAAQAQLRKFIAVAGNDSSTYDIVLAQTLVAQGKLEDAEKVLNQAVARVPAGPGNAAIRVSQAKLLMATNKTRDALTYLDKALEVAPADDNALLAKSELQIDELSFKEAIASLLSISSRHPNNSEPLRLLADAYLKSGDVISGIAVLKRAVEVKTSDLAATARLADVYRGNQQPALGNEIIASFVDRYPGSVDGRALQVNADLADNDLSKADIDLAELRRLFPAANVALLLDAQIKEARGDMPGAIEAYEKLLKSTPISVLQTRAIDGLVAAAIKSGQQGKALAIIETEAPLPQMKAIAAFLHSARAILLRSVGQLPEADEACHLALAEAPTNSAIYAQQAVDLAAHGKTDRGLRLIQRGIDAGAQPNLLLARKGAILAAAGRSDEAIAAYRGSLQHNEDSVFALNNLGVLLADREKIDTKEIEPVRARLRSYAWTGRADLLDTLGWIEYRTGHYQSALTFLQKANAETSPDPSVRYHLAATLLSVGQKDKAKQLIKTLAGHQVNMPEKLTAVE